MRMKVDKQTCKKKKIIHIQKAQETIPRLKKSEKLQISKMNKYSRKNIQYENLKIC
jgi:hypothetical protein